MAIESAVKAAEDTKRLHTAGTKSNKNEGKENTKRIICSSHQFKIFRTKKVIGRTSTHAYDTGRQKEKAKTINE